MGEINWLMVVLGTAAFFAVGALWYGVLFGRLWQKEAGVSKAPTRREMVRVMGLTLLCELVIAWMLAHLVARTSPVPWVVMMMAGGFAVGIMIPALGINYLHQRRSLTFFLIDAGHLLAGMAALGGVYVLLG